MDMRKFAYAPFSRDDLNCALGFAEPEEHVLNWLNAGIRAGKLPPFKPFVLEHHDPAYNGRRYTLSDVKKRLKAIGVWQALEAKLQWQNSHSKGA